MPLKCTATFSDLEQIFAIGRSHQAARDAGQDYDGGDATFTITLPDGTKLTGTVTITA
jgi:hypothetical protein